MYRRSGAGSQFTTCVAVAAGLAYACEKPIQSARLLGSVARLTRELGVALEVLERKTYLQDTALVRAQLSEEAFASAWAGGQALTLDQAIDEALALLDEIGAGTGATDLAR